MDVKVKFADGSEQIVEINGEGAFVSAIVSIGWLTIVDGASVQNSRAFALAELTSVEVDTRSAVRKTATKVKDAVTPKKPAAKKPAPRKPGRKRASS